ncbi:hypothetical protein [Halovivax limisalsi]|nr:hypothetical protein [Halovivax limisalsi]
MMAPDSPTLEDYEEAVGIDVDLGDVEVDRESINAELERLFDG